MVAVYWSTRPDSNWRQEIAEVLTDGNADDSNAALNLIDKMKVPTFDTSRSSATGSGLVIPNRRKLKR
jgi:hypothetical protein